MTGAQYTFSRESIRELDRIAIAQYWIPGILLMENASRGIAEHALRLLDELNATPPYNTLIVCGGGNNGGDGFGAARHLHNEGANVTLALAKPVGEYKGDAMMTLKIAQKMALPAVDVSGGADALGEPEDVTGFDLIIDAMLGTGLAEGVREPYTSLIDWINRQPKPVLAVDIPTGLDCDTGQPLGAAVRAHTTVSLVGLKNGFAQPGASDFTGNVVVSPIGAPRELIEGLGTRLDTSGGPSGA
ncbi:MAG: NAD(P)H-hydrate epimerase [Planctomycetota bacterium]|jgi:NAD(P)H-hydrate epimerase